MQVCLPICISGSTAARGACLAFLFVKNGVFPQGSVDGGAQVYQVLYRKWRPQVFADVVGQPQVTKTLQNELTAGRVAHAYLFTGCRGTGKTTCAKILAKAVNCLHPKDGDPCGACEICRGVQDGSIMDIVEIDAASNNGVDSIRMLREEANFTPAVAKYRVYIIDEVHMLSVGAFNALLKTLEEPPAHVIFILATTEVHKLPATILSRCQRFDFRRIPPEDIAARLTFIAGEEGASLDGEAALLLARLADGAMRDALSLLDQCLGRSKDVTVEVVNEAAGLASRAHLFRLADAIYAKDSAAALAVVDEMHRGGKDMARLCEELASHLRFLMLIKTMRDARPMVAVTSEEFAQLEKQALAMPLSVILHGMDTLQDALERMYRGGDRRMEMEMALLRLCCPELDDSRAALVRRIEALEKHAPTAVAQPEIQQPQPAPEPPAPERTVPQKLAAVPAAPQEEPPKTASENRPAAPLATSAPVPAQEPPKSAEAVKTAAQLAAEAVPLPEWPEVVQALKQYSHTIAAAFRNTSAYVSGNYVLIDAANDLAFSLLRESSQRDSMRRAIQQVTGRTYKLGPYRPAEKQDAEKDPLLAMAERAQEQGIDVVKK
ncbi:DNA polymerase III subunit gamma/tau [Caproicibacterium argilliputei]